MSNAATKIVLVVVLALPAASFARAGGAAESSARAAMIAADPIPDPSGMTNANKVAPIPPPRIYVPAIPQFK